MADTSTNSWKLLYEAGRQALQDRKLQEAEQSFSAALQLAEELGAHTVLRPGESVVGTVMDYARRHNITKIVTGKPARPRWIDLLRGDETAFYVWF